MKDVDPHSYYSPRREKILENLFIGEVLRVLWTRGEYEVEILQSDIDAAGYDIVLSLPEGTRYIQLKSMVNKRDVSITANGKISDKIGGCIVLMVINRETLKFEGFYWIGGTLTEYCSNIRKSKTAKHTKGNSEGVKSERKDTYTLGKTKFTYFPSIEDIIDKLIETKS